MYKNVFYGGCVCYQQLEAKSMIQLRATLAGIRLERRVVQDEL